MADNGEMITQKENTSSFEKALLFLVSAVLPALYLLPLLVNPATYVAGYGDVWQHLWNMWWFKHSLALNLDPFWTSEMYFPTGASLVFHSYSIYNMILGLISSMFLRVEVIYNILIAKSLILSAISAYFLGKELTSNRMSGILCGLVWSFSSHHLSHIMFLHIFSIEVLPLCFLFYVRYLRKRATVYLFACALSIVVSTLASWYFLVFLFLLFGVLLSLTRDLLTLKKLGLFIVILCVLLAPFLYLPFTEYLASPGATVVPLDMMKIFSSDILSFFIPPESNPLFSGVVSPFYLKVHTHHTERTHYLGFSALFLTLLFVFASLKRYAYKRKRSNAPEAYNENLRELSDERIEQTMTMFVSAGLFLGMILACGPYLQVNGQIFETIHLPYYYLSSLPPFSLMRSPNRFLMLTCFCLAIGAAFGWRLLSEKMVERGLSRRGRYVVFLSVSLFFFVESMCSLTVPKSKSTLSHPFFDKLSEQPDHYPVLTIPLPQQDFSLPLYHQTIHEKPLFGGYISRDPIRGEQFIDSNAFLDFAREGRLAITRAEVANLKRLLNRWKVPFLIIYKGGITNQSLTFLNDWGNKSIGTPSYEDDDFLIFNLPDTTESIEAITPYNLLKPPLNIPFYLFRNKSNGKIVVQEIDNKLYKEWVLWENGSLSQEIQIENEGYYLLQYWAYGTPLDSVYPAISLSIDEKFVGETLLDNVMKQRGPWIVFLEQGNHEIKLTFTNDAADEQEDRNAIFLFFNISPRKIDTLAQKNS